jgi:hypothetical protein
VADNVTIVDLKKEAQDKLAKATSEEQGNSKIESTPSNNKK